MSDSGDDLPDLEIAGHYVCDQKYTITRINVDAEIAQNCARKELKKKILEQKLVFDDKSEGLPDIPPLPEPKICAFPPKRQIFYANRSLRSFNCDSLTTEKLCPSHLNTCTSENVEELFSWLRSKFKNSDSTDQRIYLLYSFLLMSCHPDQFIVQNCYDFLIEHNSSWRLKFDEVVLLFYNWGTSPKDFVSEHDLKSIISSFEAGPLIPVSNVEKVSPNICTPLNVTKVLQVLSYQLLVKNMEGNENCKKSVFILLTLLVLDSDYFSCLSAVHDCLDEISKSQSSPWVAEYTESLLLAVSHHAEIAFLSECVVPECMQWCLCLAYCQRVFSLQQTFVADPDPLLLLNILLDHFDTLMKLDSWELYSLISIASSGISHVVSFESDREIKKGFLNLLNQYMERKIERRTEDIDVDATRIEELVTRLQAEWESNWFPEPTVPLNVDIVKGAHVNEV